MANKPNNPALWSRAKSLAKQKFDVYPCVPMDSEALTKDGWKKYDQLTEGEEILSYNKDTGVNEWTPILVLQYYKNAPLIRLFKAQTNCDVRCTPNHKWVLDSTNIKYPDNLVEAQDITTHMKIKTSAPIKVEDQPGVDLQAFSKSDSWVKKVLMMSVPQLQAFFASGIVYDGHDKGFTVKGDKQTFGFSQKNQDHGNAMEIAAVLLGYRVCSVVKKHNPSMRSWTFITRSFESTQNLKKEDVGVEDVWCPTTKNQTWVMRQNGYVTITGNSAYANGWAAKWYKGKGGSWRKAEYGMEVMGDGGSPDNAGFRALPPAVQQKIMDNMAQGGEKMPPEIARARFAAAGNLDQMGDYGYVYGGYIPEMMYGGREYMQEGGQQDQIMQLIQMYAQMNQIDPEQLMQKLQQMPPEEQQQAIQQMAQTLEQGAGQQQPDMQQAAMRYGGYMTGMFADGGESNAGMALGQIAAMHDKLSRLQKFITGPDREVDPWVASKITLADDYLNSVADYMQYGEQQEPENEIPGANYEQQEMMANGGYTVTRSNDRKGKTHKVTGPDGTVKYFGDSNLGQHPKDEKRKAAFYARHKTNLANNPFFRAFARKTWKEGGSTFSGNAFYQGGGGYFPEAMPFPADYSAEMMQQPDMQQGSYMENNGNFAMQMGGVMEGEVMDVSPDQLEVLRQQGYQFEIM